MALALRLGRTRRELLASIDSDELADWIAFNNIDPITQDRGDAQAALICQTMANAWKASSQPAFRLDQFMPKYHRDKKHDKPSLRNQFKAFCAMKGVPQRKK